MNSTFLAHLKNLVVENLKNEQFGVSELAKQLGISRSQLHRKVKAEYKNSISVFIRDIRLSEAQKLLNDDTLTVSEIAYRVGFSNPSYFNNCFHDKYGITPGEARGKDLQETGFKSSDTSSSFFKQKSIFFLFSIVLIVIIAIISTLIINRKSNIIKRDKSIAILPFENLSSNSENKYFADGIVEDLLNRISKLEGLKVISRTSSERFRDRKDLTIPEIAEQLKVCYILEGSVQREANNVRITVQLIDAISDDHVFSRQYDRMLNQVFTIQSEIATEIANELSYAINEKGGPNINENPTESIVAFDYYQMGQFHFTKRTEEDILTSIAYFKKAIQEDPEFVQAYSELAHAYWVYSLYGYSNVKSGIDSAWLYLNKASDIDSNNAEIHQVKGDLLLEYEYNIQAAENEFIKAIKLNPNYYSSYHSYAALKFIQRDYNKARELIDKAIEYDPFSFIVRNTSSDIYLAQADFKKALSENRICHELDKKNWIPPKNAFYINIQLKDYPAAIKSFKELGQITGEYTNEMVDSIYKLNGLKGLYELRSRTVDKPSDKGEYFVLLGEYELAIDKLEESFNNKTLSPYFVAIPSFKPLWNNPRYIELLNKMNIHPVSRKD